MADADPGRVLVVDDEPDLLHAYTSALARAGFDARAAAAGPAALDQLRRGDFDVLLTDLHLPGMDGVALLRAALEVDPQLVVILMTGQGTVQTAVEAMKGGAFDYLLKPFRLPDLLPTLARAMDVRRLRRENVRLKAHLERLTFASARLRLIGGGPAMRKVVQLIEKVAPTDATVLIRGASGTGKELVARAIHHNSPRRDRPLVAVNCAALQETLLESELFGHEKGSFTGATLAKPGLFEVAEGGTLFIDEIAEMSPGMQTKLLRVLEDGRYRRVGGTQELRADVRIVAATNRPLEAEQQAGRFREDLYYRLNVVSIPIPPLKDRREDIPALVEHLLATRPVGGRRFTVEPAALQALQAYEWPGNVRELANVLERAQILAEGGTITPDDLPDTVTAAAPAADAATPAAPAADPNALREVERRHILRVLEEAGGNKMRAAKLLGVSRRALYRLIAKYHLDEPPGHAASG